MIAVHVIDEYELLREGFNFVRQSTWRLGLLCWFRAPSWDAGYARHPGVKYTLLWHFPYVSIKRERC